MMTSKIVKTEEEKGFLELIEPWIAKQVSKAFVGIGSDPEEREFLEFKYYGMTRMVAKERVEKELNLMSQYLNYLLDLNEIESWTTTRVKGKLVKKDSEFQWIPTHKVVMIKVDPNSTMEMDYTEGKEAKDGMVEYETSPIDLSFDDLKEIVSNSRFSQAEAGGWNT